MSKKITCCLCGKKIDEHLGNNPWPIKETEGRCCNECNVKLVIPARMRLVLKNLEEQY